MDSKTQKLIMANFMLANTDIARSHRWRSSGIDDSKTRIISESKWDELVLLLNNANGISRRKALWKKCWTDQKKYVQTKLNRIKRTSEATGRVQELSDVENIIVKAAGLKPDRRISSDVFSEEMSTESQNQTISTRTLFEEDETDNKDCFTITLPALSPKPYQPESVLYHDETTLTDRQIKRTLEYCMKTIKRLSKNLDQDSQLVLEHVNDSLELCVDLMNNRA